VILGELGNFPLRGVDLGHFVGGFGWFWRVRLFSFMRSSFGALCRWFLVVLGELGNFPLWGDDLGH
jgi:hypothetical protein